MNTNSSRRAFLRAGASLASVPALQRIGAPITMGLAGLAAMAAQSSSASGVSGGYKALVCLFMHGGNDSHNWVIPTDATGYAEYAAARRELAWASSDLQPIAVSGQSAGRSFGMPSPLQPLRKWYQSGQAAIVANVGPLVRPLSLPEVQAGVDLPSKLYSHNDQASTWQSLWPEGADTGWGGRMGDLLLAANAYPVLTAISASGNAVFLSGNQVTQYQIGVDGPVAVSGLDSSSIFSAHGGPGALQRILAAHGNNPLRTEYARTMQRSLETGALLQTALAGVNVPAIPATSIPLGTGGSVSLNTDGLARQLRIVAQLVAAGQGLGMQRQVFMVSMGGFDSHAHQMRDQPSQMARVAHAVDYFLSALSALGLLNKVTLFTASDFGRTLLSNGSGSDHGWGSHHFVAGGAVHGGQMYGRFPITAIGGAEDVGSGRLLPAHSVSQMAAPLGRWLGLSSGEVASVLPGLENFDANALAFV